MHSDPPMKSRLVQTPLFLLHDLDLLPRLRALWRQSRTRWRSHQAAGESAAPSAYREAIAQMSDGLVIVDDRGCIAEVNPAAARILSRPASALLGLPLAQILPDDPGCPPSAAACQRQATVHTAQGERRIELRCLPRPNGDHRPAGQAFLLQDITAGCRTTLAAQEANEAANRVKEEFLATISHELDTPLNHIIGYVDLMLMDTYGPLTAGQRERLAQVSGDAHHLAELIADTIDLSRLEAGDFRLQLEPVAPLPLLQECLASITPLARSCGLQVYSNLPPALPGILANGRRLRQVMDKLLANAVKFTPEGWIDLHAAMVMREQALAFPIDLPDVPAACYCLLAVQDSGIGIAARDQPLIFEHFRQVDSSYARPYSGAGIGLALAYRLTLLMNGRMWVESAPRQGSTLFILLPVAEQAAQSDC